MHDPLHPDEAIRAERFAGLTRVLELADALGAAGVVCVAVRPPQTFWGMADQDRGLMEFGEREFSGGVDALPGGRSAVFFEPLNRYEATFLRRVEQAVELASRVNHPRVAALADLFHMNIEEADLGEPIHASKGLLGHVHIADNNRLQPGAGCLDFMTPFAALKKMEYGGFISIECSALGGPLAAAGPDAMLTESVRFLRRMWEAA
jgi:sugar phosphate isomerase/epimerase